jgi:hypothetical protein
MFESQFKQLIHLPLVPGISLYIGNRLLTCLGVFFALYFLAGQSGSQSLYLLCAAILSFIFLGLLLPYLQLLDTRVSVLLPHEATAGDRLALKLRPSHAILNGLLSLLFPLQLIRLTVYLSKQNGQTVDILELPALIEEVEEDGYIEASTIPLERGLYNVSSLSAVTCFPFGMCWWVSKLPVCLAQNKETLTVYAKVLTISGRRLSPQNVSTRGASMTRVNEKELSFQESNSVRALRPYRQGDSPSRIHWRSTARTGRLIVKEFDCETSSDQLILLDTEAPWQSQDQFELAVCLANSIMHNQSNSVNRDLIVPPSKFIDEVMNMPAGVQRSKEILARVQVVPQSSPINYASAERATVFRIKSLFAETLRKHPDSIVFAVIPGEDATSVNLVEITPRQYGRSSHKHSASQSQQPIHKGAIAGLKSLVGQKKPPQVSTAQARAPQVSNNKEIVARISSQTQIAQL